MVRASALWYSKGGYCPPLSLFLPTKSRNNEVKGKKQQQATRVFSTFASLMELFYNDGNQYISDSDFINHGFNADLDANGNERIIDETISQENQQRARCLTVFLPIFQNPKKCPSSTLSITFLVRMCTFNISPPPSQWRSNPPPPLFTRKILCYKRESIKRPS